jgi:hypothetical protein
MIGKTIMTKTNITETPNKYDTIVIPNILVTEENKFNYGYPIKSTTYRLGRFDVAVIAANIVSKKIKPDVVGDLGTKIFKLICRAENPIIGFDSLEEADLILPKNLDKSKIIDYTKEIL